MNVSLSVASNLTTSWGIYEGSDIAPDLGSRRCRTAHRRDTGEWSYGCVGGGGDSRCGGRWGV